jgi:glycosyltransferase involved in cell wall biosynthesis
VPDGAPRDAERLDVCLVGLLVAAAPHGSGVPRYAAELTRALDAAAPEFPSLSVSLLTTREGAEIAAPRNLDVRPAHIPFGSAAGAMRVVAEQLAVAHRGRAGLLHFFDLSGPVLRPHRRFTTTIHDASIVHGYERVRHAYKRRLYPWALRRAARVVAVSEFARSEAVRHLGGDAGRITVVHSGPGFLADGAGVPAGLPEPPYLLYVGDLSPKKDVAPLVGAFAETGAPGRLVLAGRRRDAYPDLDRALAAAGPRVVLLEGPSDAAVDALLRGASALLLPSRYEGFAFTPLEAMGRGCPVVASDIPAVREISGEGALLVPPGDAAAWRDAILRVTGDEALRAELRERGAATVARYSWLETARGLLRVFDSLRTAA